MIDEIIRHEAILMKQLNCTQKQIEDFCEVSGLDLSDLLYKEDCCEAFEVWLKTKKVNHNVNGFYYEWAVGWKPSRHYTKLWIEKHTRLS